MKENNRLIGGRYRLRQKVGQGAMGVVWQAYDEQLHRVVAAKELLALDGLDDFRIERAKARAMREARLAARLEHPNAIRVYDAVEDDGQPWLIMEYLPSRSLAAVIAEQGTLPPREVARIGCYTAAALAAAHRNGIQHRDVKPGNVLIGDQEVKITDFGISRATGDDGTATATGTVGTPAYFSPEVARGDEAGFPSDVFSLGATLYTAVEGGPPFGTADNHIAMLHRVASGSIMPPANAGPLLSPVLFRLLATDPDRRPTMVEAVQLLAAVVNETPQVSEATAVIPATMELPVEALPEEEAKAKKAAAGTAAAGAAAAGLVAAAAQNEAAALTAPGGTTEPDEAEPAAEPETADESPAAESGTAASEVDQTSAPAEEVAKEPEAEPAPSAEGATAVAQAAPPAPTRPYTPPATSPTSEAPAQAEEERRKNPLALVAIIFLVIAVGVGAFLLWPKGGGNPTANKNPATGSSTPQTGQSQTQPQTQPQAPTETQPQTNPQTNPPSSITPNPPAPSPEAPQTAQQALTSYYALIPGDLPTGYTLLTDRFKAARVQTFAKYQTFWSQYTSVQLSDFAPQGDNVVNVTVRFMQGSNVSSTERHTYTLVQQNGKWMIDGQAP